MDEKVYFGILEINFRSTGKRDLRPVCVDQWNDGWSDQACRQLGYPGHKSSSSRYDFTRRDEEFWYRNVSIPVSGNLIQKAGAQEGRCRSKEAVELECEQFGKPTLRERGTILRNVF